MWNQIIQFPLLSINYDDSQVICYDLIQSLKISPFLFRILKKFTIYFWSHYLPEKSWALINIVSLVAISHYTIYGRNRPLKGIIPFQIKNCKMKENGDDRKSTLIATINDRQSEHKKWLLIFIRIRIYPTDQYSHWAIERMLSNDLGMGKTNHSRWLILQKMSQTSRNKIKYVSSCLLIPIIVCFEIISIFLESAVINDLRVVVTQEIPWNTFKETTNYKIKWFARKSQELNNNNNKKNDIRISSVPADDEHNRNSFIQAKSDKWFSNIQNWKYFKMELKCIMVLNGRVYTVCKRYEQLCTHLNKKNPYTFVEKEKSKRK